MTISFPSLLSSSSPFHSLWVVEARENAGDMQKVQLETVVPLFRFLINIHQRRLDGSFYRDKLCVCVWPKYFITLAYIHPSNSSPVSTSANGPISGGNKKWPGNSGASESGGYKLNIFAFPFAHLIQKIASSRLFRLFDRNFIKSASIGPSFPFCLHSAFSSLSKRLSTANPVYSALPRHASSNLFCVSHFMCRLVACPFV